MDNLLTSSLLEWLGDHRQWLGLAIFLIALLESLAVAGLVIPGVFLLLGVTAMAGGGGMPFASALAWAFCGAVLGDMFSFALGRFFHEDIRRLSLFRRHPQWIARGEIFFRRYGLFGIFIGRFVGPIRPVIPMIAGMLDMPSIRFVTINLLSALAWAPVYVTPGFLAGRAVKWPVPEFFWQHALTLLGLLSGLLLAVILILRAQKRWSNILAGLLCLAALVLVSVNGERLAILDQSLAVWLSIADTNGWLAGAMADLASPLYPAALFFLLAVSLTASQAWRALSFTLLALVTGGLLAVALDASQQATVLAASLVLIAIAALLKNRPHAFWTRAAFMSGVAPQAILLGAISLAVMHLSLMGLIDAFLLAATSLLLSLWVVERAGPVECPASPARHLLLWVPLASAIGVVSGLHYF
ncbi:DedA family protein [uncultured Halopseudomonas sp.]|uniref:DedA family protein n=1 Tax=uncultured Halopseudomonas sp. TaxID=2901193 RepID=UPI0030EED4D0|tara:strand:- start:152715 stop:153956 length:1242 start_codon:yes stop_codon:yes gene_type:complete